MILKVPSSKLENLSEVYKEKSTIYVWPNLQIPTDTYNTMIGTTKICGFVLTPKSEAKAKELHMNGAEKIISGPWIKPRMSRVLAEALQPLQKISNKKYQKLLK